MRPKVPQESQRARGDRQKSDDSHQCENVVGSPDEGADDGDHEQLGAKFDLWTCHTDGSERAKWTDGKPK
jgi:hypothetical protein